LVMVGEINLKHNPENDIIIDSIRNSRKIMEDTLCLMDKDSNAYTKVVEAYSLPRNSDEDKARRSAAIQESLKNASLVPLEIEKKSLEIIRIGRKMADIVNGDSICDLNVGIIMAEAGMRAARMNVEINLKGIKNREFVESILDEQRTIIYESDEILKSMNMFRTF